MFTVEQTFDTKLTTLDPITAFLSLPMQIPTLAVQSQETVEIHLPTCLLALKNLPNGPRPPSSVLAEPIEPTTRHTIRPLQIVLSLRPVLLLLLSFASEVTPASRLATLTLAEPTRKGQEETALLRIWLTQARMFADIDKTSVTLTTLTEFVKVARTASVPPATRPPRDSERVAKKSTEAPPAPETRSILVRRLSLGADLQGLELSTTLLLRSPIAWEVHLLVKLGPRAITTTSPLPETLPKTLTTRMSARELKVFAGLLVKRTLGLPIKVSVTVISRTRLFDTRPGCPRSRPLRFIPLTVLPVSWWCLVPFMLERARVSLMPVRIDRRGTRPQSRDMKFTERRWQGL